VKFLSFSGLALLLLSVEAVLGRAVELDVTRIDVGLAIVVYVGLAATTMEGAFTAFAVGYLLDVFTGRPTGLYPFLAMFVFLLVRGVSQLVDGRSRGGFGLFVAAAAFGHGLLAGFFSWLTARQEGGVSWTGLPLQVLLATAAGLALWPLFKRIEPGDHPEPGRLR
jgi:hypothetical protein